MADKASGLVTQLYPPAKSWLNFTINDTTVVPKDGYFQVFQSHPNYRETYTLLLAAALNRLTVNVHTTKDVKSTEYAKVDYVWVNWSSGSSGGVSEGNIQRDLDRIEEKLDKMAERLDRPS
jgi:hypothetical protein